MTTKMTPQEIIYCAETLANQIDSGITLSESAHILIELQPKYQEFWQTTQSNIEKGIPLSESIVGVWPDPIVTVIKAGEESGKLADVLNQVAKTLILQLKIVGQLKKLNYPLGILIVGILMVLGILIGLVPIFAKYVPNRPNTSPGPIFAISNFFHEAFINYWYVILPAIIIGVVTLVLWILSEEGKQTIIDALLNTPVVGPVVVNLYFGLWCRYLAMVFSSGIPLLHALTLTKNNLPRGLIEGVNLFEDDLKIKSLPIEQAVNVSRLPETDPRRKWPLYLRRAFVVGAKSGELDTHLLRASPLLIDDSIIKLGLFINVAQTFAYTLSGSALGLSFFTMYSPLISLMKGMH